ncbi:splicing factor 45-like [Paramacrobiotus metropolitanus]|uniref:splicing factor 45-like n=1 Tax=Paramacrobiotus metropolitanus TaxID=2943436 RepID=UPI0024459AA6|nr:splicing factor 45-like [Paramacrobiotus metropolitanus]
MSSLYDGLEESSTDDSTKTPSNSAQATSIKFLQSQLQLKKAALQQTKQNLKPHLPPTTTPNTLLRPAKFTPAVKLEPAKLDIPLLSATIQRVANEYDPLYPNEYDKVKAIQTAEAAALTASTKNPFQATFSNTIGLRSALSAPEEEEAPTAGGKILGMPPTKRGAAIPPPPESGVMESGSAVAAKIMAKFGYKEGSGLGRQEQGIASALQVEKTGLRAGKILREAPPEPPSSLFAMPPPKFNTPDLFRSQTKVLLLRNMVGPGDVDNDLEPEVKEECSNFGEVVTCLIYELPGKPDDEAVRIFVEFAKVEQAVKAVVTMNGRFFGGRAVKAGFYDIDKFKKFQLAEPV